MKKAIIGTIVGAVAYFAWGALSWTVIPWHRATIKPLPNESLVTDTLKTVLKEPGFYAFPGGKDAAGHPLDKAGWMAKMKEGPLGAIAFSPQGTDKPFAGYTRTIVGDLVTAALLMWILWASRLKRAVHRIHLAAAVGLIAGIGGPVLMWSWFHFPGAFTAVGVLDLLFGFIVMGAVMCPFVPETL